jgi:hypothetical protein
MSDQDRLLLEGTTRRFIAHRRLSRVVGRLRSHACHHESGEAFERPPFRLS